jgi:hypothetical protein
LLGLVWFFCLADFYRRIDCSAGLTDGAGKTLVSAVKYTLGSVWAPIPAASDTFAATSAAGAKIASAPMTPPNAPQVFTAFLLGTKSFGYTLMPQIDAPEFGPCRPGGSAQKLGCAQNTSAVDV